MTKLLSTSNVHVRATDTEPSDRRSSSRTATLFRPALLESADFRSFCLVRNISDTGLRLRAYAHLKIAQEVSVSFTEALNLTGKVVWQKGLEAGVEFFSPVDVEPLLKQLGNKYFDTIAHRSPRLLVRCEAEFATLQDRHPIKIVDISQRGIKALIGKNQPSVGEPGSLRVPGLEPRRSVVRWVQRETVGFYFLEPIGFDELGQWVMRQYEDGNLAV
ncbi:PilZ domain-containing protein [Altererythrobacter sp. GH1-8]|uniref:PilZ domain-containing protein n=1 Tax=Altererythrobacter sp. GH1-8 TaxID=3349333 RepID=UPI00374C947C